MHFQKKKEKHLLCCSNLINNSKEKQTPEKGAVKTSRLKECPQMRKIQLLQNKSKRKET